VFSRYYDRETTVGLLGPGQSFIVAAVLLDRIYLKSARTLSDSRILMIPADVVRQSFEEDAAFARALAVELARAYRGVIKELKNQKLRSSLERIANWLLLRDAETGSTGRFEFPFSKKVLASRIGTTPEALSRSFAALGRYQVEIQGLSVELQNVEGLRQLARPCQTIDDQET
jgi:CRP/FNR family transcriptional activator FtrB